MRLTAERLSRSPRAQKGSVRHRGGRVPVDVFGVALVLAAAAAALLPALLRGTSLGSMDWASQFGLLQYKGLVVHNREVSDQADLFIPWMSVAWHQVHSGNLPLWNPYSAWGMPLAFNWQSTVFSLPALVGYLFPIRLDYTVQVVVTLAVAGTGVYVLGRTLRLGVLGSAFAGIVFELSGSFFGWLGWPASSVISWVGWLFVAAIFVLRGGRRLRSVVFFAVVVALALYGGYPEAVGLLAIALVVFVVVMLAGAARSESSPPAWRSVQDLTVAAIAGVLLAAPLVLPGLQLVSHSIRNASYSGNSTASPAVGTALAPHNVFHLIFQGFDGWPMSSSKWFGMPIYLFTSMYVGVIAVVLCVAAAVTLWQVPAVRAFVLVAVASLGLVFFQPLVSIMHRVPGAQGFRWYEASFILDFALAVLAGFGIDAFVRRRAPAVDRWLVGGLGAVALVLAATWFFGRGHLPRQEAGIRAASFIWPVAQLAVGLAAMAATGLLGGRDRREVSAFPARAPRLWAAGTLLVCEAAFLVSSGAPLWSSSPGLYTVTPAATAFQRAVGTSLVGFGAPDCYLPPGYGIPEDVNAFFGVQELAVHDPLTPKAYYTGWVELTGSAESIPQQEPNFQIFCPGIDSVSLARVAGVSFILERRNDPGPAGTRFLMTLGDEALYSVPNSAAATLTSLSADGGLPPATARGTPVPVTHPNPRTWRVVESSDVPSELRLRLSNVPGLHATIDGRPLALSPFVGMLLQARVPAGHHVVEVAYWPRAFSAGIVLALVTALCLIGASVWVGARRKHDDRWEPEHRP